VPVDANMKELKEFRKYFDSKLREFLSNLSVEEKENERLKRYTGKMKEEIYLWVEGWRREYQSGIQVAERMSGTLCEQYKNQLRSVLYSLLNIQRRALDDAFAALVIRWVKIKK
jgi:hypothetical protein